MRNTETNPNEPLNNTDGIRICRSLIVDAKEYYKVGKKNFGDATTVLVIKVANQFVPSLVSEYKREIRNMKARYKNVK